MRNRLTSRVAYKQINKDGTAKSQTKIILDLINDLSNVDKGFGLSLKEIARQTGFEINAVSGRVNELKKNELVKECNKRRCRITGRLITPVTFN
jgi:predicted transcriptional regulator